MAHSVIKGEVVGGNRLGSKLGFPTVNLPVSDGTRVRNGVYAALVATPYGRYRAMVNIGTRPTVTDSRQRFAEAHIFGFEGDLYGQQIEITLIEFVRPEKAFASVEELKEQIGKDKKYITELDHEKQ